MKHEQLTDMVSPIILAKGLECWGVEYSPSYGHGLIRVYIDASDRPITLDDCELVSREVSALFDKQEPVAGQYTLEISSPGLDRPLFVPEHFARFIGEQVKLNLTLPLNGRRRFQGVVLGVNGPTITIEQDGVPVDIPHGNIQKARLVATFAELKKKPKPKNAKV